VGLKRRKMPKDDGKVEEFLGADKGADELNPQELESITGSLGVVGGGGFGPPKLGYTTGGTNPDCVATTDSAGMGCSGTGDG
jgi:hypothetical protein